MKNIPYLVVCLNPSKASTSRASATTPSSTVTGFGFEHYVRYGAENIRTLEDVRTLTGEFLQRNLVLCNIIPLGGAHSSATGERAKEAAVNWSIPGTKPGCMSYDTSLVELDESGRLDEDSISHLRTKVSKGKNVLLEEVAILCVVFLPLVPQSTIDAD